MAYTLHDRAGTLASLLYKAEKPSVRTFQVWRSVSRPWLHGLTPDLLEMIAISSGTTKFILLLLFYYLPLLCELRKRRLCTEEKDTNTSVYSSII